MCEQIRMGILILPEIKEVYRDDDVNITCMYEGCGADDGWPEKYL